MSKDRFGVASVARRAPISVTAKTLLCLGLGILAPVTLLANGGVTFHDITSDTTTGVTYQRVRSPRDTLFDMIKQQATYTFPDLTMTPLKSRGAPGVAILDYDGDGDEDIYVTNGPGANNSLYSNQLRETGALTFVDVGAAAGVGAFDQDSNGVCFGDIDNDRDPDLFVLGSGEANRLFENQGDGSFLDITATSGTDGGATTSMSCSMGDIDGDGLLDIVVANLYADPGVQLPIFVLPFDSNQHNQLLRNQGANRFEDVSESSGFMNLDLPPQAPPGAATITWAIAMVDIDLDGDIDIIQDDDQAAFPNGALGGIDRGYVQYFRNDGTGNFENVTLESGLVRPGAWMGLSFGDYNQDGLMDFFSSNLGNHALIVFNPMADFNLDNRDSSWFLQNASGTFTDSSADRFLNTPFGWGTSSEDYDNDGDTDIIFHGALDLGPFVPTTPGVVLRNDGNANFHRDTAAMASSIDHRRRTVHGVAAGDLNQDGFIDIVSVSNFNFPEPIPLIPAPPLGGEFDVDAAFLPTFVPVDPVNFVFQWAGLELPDGNLAVELAESDNGNRSVQIKLLGTVGLTTGGQVNRDGIGAVIKSTTAVDKSALHPILGGSSYASQDSLIATIGVGKQQFAAIDVLWPGGVRNRFFLRAGTQALLPEIPCSFDDPGPFSDYVGCVSGALDELEAAGVVDSVTKLQFLIDAIVAFVGE